MTDADADTDPEADWILYEKDPVTKIATLTLNRPDRLNAPTIGMRLRYADLLHQANIDDDVARERRAHSGAARPFFDSRHSGGNRLS